MKISYYKLPENTIGTAFRKVDIEINDKNNSCENSNISIKKQLKEQQNNDPVEIPIFVESTSINMENLSNAVLTDYSIIVNGPISCGKTYLVEYLSSISNKRLVK